MLSQSCFWTGRRCIPTEPIHCLWANMAMAEPAYEVKVFLDLLPVRAPRYQWMRFFDTRDRLTFYHIHLTGNSTLLSELLTKKQKTFEPHFKPDLLQRTSTVFQFEFTSGEDFFLYVSQDSFSFKEGSAANPTLTLYLDHHETCWQLLIGTRDGMDAFMNSQYRADGNIVLSQLLLYLFKSANRAVAFKVQD